MKNASVARLIYCSFISDISTISSAVRIAGSILKLIATLFLLDGQRPDKLSRTFLPYKNEWTL